MNHLRTLPYTHGGHRVLLMPLLRFDPVPPSLSASVKRDLDTAFIHISFAVLRQATRPTVKHTIRDTPSCRGGRALVMERVTWRYR